MNAKANLAYIIPSNEKAPYMFLNVTVVELYCPNCDSKKFAQRVGVKMRNIYKLDASSTKFL